jgi:outer membrane lipoprotein SlyB
MHNLKRAAVIALTVILTGCANTPLFAGPVHTATIVDVSYTTREVKSPSVGGALIGALIGGAAGNKIGGGNGKKVATVLGAAAGGVAGAAAGAKTNTVPATYVLLRDDESGALFNATLDGTWKSGTHIRYTNKDGRFALR